MGAPSAPPIPDATQTASAQGEANVSTATGQAALNNANVITPLGSSTYAVTGSQNVPQPDGTISTVPTYTNTQTLSPSQQHLYNQQTHVASLENQGASELIQNAEGEISNPLTGGNIQTSIDPQTANLQSWFQKPTTSMVSGVDTSGIQSGIANNGSQIQTSLGPLNPIQSSVANNGNQIGTNYANFNGGILGSLGATDNSAAVNQTINAQLQLLQPTVANQNEALASQLASQGIAPGSQAWTTAMNQQGTNVNNLDLQAVGLGDQEQQALYGEQLSSGQFQNSADAQAYAQAMGATNAQNAALGQQFGQNVTAGNFANSAQNQQYTQALGAGNFTNAALGQQFAQGAATGAFANAAQGQTNSEAQANAALANSVNAQQYNQGMSNTELSNNVAAQAFSQNSAAAAFGNQAAAQQLQQNQTINSQDINDLSALLHGGQVSMSQFQPYQTADIGQTPISADTYASANLAEQQYQQQASMYGSDMGALGSLFGGVGTALGSYLKSDPDLKDDHGVVGMLGELPVHAFNYKGDDTPLVGFMADEVHPSAVARMKNGYRVVDYLKALQHA